MFSPLFLYKVFFFLSFYHPDEANHVSWKASMIIDELKKVSNCYYYERLPAHSPLHYSRDSNCIFLTMYGKLHTFVWRMLLQWPFERHLPRSGRLPRILWYTRSSNVIISWLLCALYRMTIASYDPTLDDIGVHYYMYRGVIKKKTRAH